MSNKFNGERLRQARIYAGLSINDLAKILDVTKQAISQYETANVTPEFNKMVRITDKLNFPSAYFFQSDNYDITPSTTYFRALLTTNKNSRLQQISKMKHFIVIYEILNKYIVYPKLNLPTISDELKENLTIDNIEKIANSTREYWGLCNKPIDNIVNVFERNGIMVTSYSTESSIDAYSQKVKINNNERFIIVLSNDKESAARTNFDAAHELGHILLHDWNIDLEELSREEFKQREREANDFAAAFLLPQRTFTKDVSIYPKDLKHYIELKKKWKVSMSAMIIRAHKLGIISDNSYQYLMKQLSYKNWRQREPLDDILVKSESCLLDKSIDMLLNNNIFNKKTFLEELSEEGIAMKPSEVEKLLNLTPGKLTVVENKIGNAIKLELKK